MKPFGPRHAPIDGSTGWTPTIGSSELMGAAEQTQPPALPGLELASPCTQGADAEETSLVERARTGDQESFGMLVRLHQRQVYLLSLRMLHDDEEATEATQEVFLAAWQGLQAFRGDARFATWLYRIAYNYCLKQAQHQRRVAQVKRELVEASAREQSLAETISASHARDAEHRMRETVRSEINNLPAKYRAVLVLRHLQELSYEEMASIMRVPVGTVKTQLFRARALLKERLEDLGRFRDEGVARAEEVRTGIEIGLRGMLDQRIRSPEKEVGKE